MPVTALAGSSSTFATEVAPGALGFLVVFAMAVALYFLLRSMIKQLRKVDSDKTTFVAAAGATKPTATSAATSTSTTSATDTSQDS